MSAQPPATTTTVTVTTDAAPASAPPVQWYRSQKFKAYVGSWLTLDIGWLGQCLSSNTWEWKALAISSLLIAGLVVKDWMQADVIAPLGAMNRNNVTPGAPKQ
ncbi:MAG: hypothetical protein WC969_14760 [Elusimicrobiota bacterium]